MINERSFKVVARRRPHFDIFLKLGRLWISVRRHNVGRWNLDRDPYCLWAWKLQLPFVHVRWMRPSGYIPEE